MPRTKGRHRKPRPPIVPTAALAGTGVAALVVTIASGGSPSEFVDAHTSPWTIDPTPTAAATGPGSELSAGSDHGSRESMTVAQAANARDASSSAASPSTASAPAGSTGDQAPSGSGTGGGSTGDQGSPGSPPPAEDPSGPLPGDAPLPTSSPSPSPTQDVPLPKLPDLPLPDTSVLPSVNIGVGTG